MRWTIAESDVVVQSSVENSEINEGMLVKLASKVFSCVVKKRFGSFTKWCRIRVKFFPKGEE